MFLKYRLDGSLFDPRRLKAKTKIFETIVREALFADDCALMAHTEADLQLVVKSLLKHRDSLASLLVSVRQKF